MKEQISKLFIKHSMHTNQALINDLVILLQEQKQETITEVLEFLDHLEITQPDDMKTDNWRNWKYIRNSIVDKYELKQEKQ